MILYLTDWLKKLILLILLATIVDLLLPNSNMQRYARLVIGLLIILTMLSPIFSLFNINKLGTLISYNNFLLSSNTKTTEDFTLIEKQANQLRKVRQGEIIDQFAQNFEKEIAVELERVYQTKADVKVSMYINKDSEAKIDKIMVYLLGRVHKKDNKDNPYKLNETIESIPAIEIKIGEENENETDSNHEAMSESSREIHRFLTSSYQLTDAQVEIRLK